MGPSGSIGYILYIYWTVWDRYMQVLFLGRAPDSCHGRVSGINKICIRSSSYCRSQATAA